MNVVQFQPRQHADTIDAIDPAIIDMLTPPRLNALARIVSRGGRPPMRLLPALTDLIVLTRRNMPADTMSRRTGLPIDGCRAFIDGYTAPATPTNA